MTGLFFEDCRDDLTFTSEARTITESDITAFASLTGDFSELHTNEEFARATPFGQRIAHGALVFSLSIGLATIAVPIGDTLLAFAGVDNLRFVKPVFIGDTIHILKRLHERREFGPDRGVVVFQTSVINQRKEIVLMYHDKLLLRRRGAATSPA